MSDYKCAHCADTGSLSKDIDGSLDCVYCPAALQRVGLETWALAENLDVGMSALWLIYLKGVADGKAIKNGGAE